MPSVCVVPVELPVELVELAPVVPDVCVVDAGAVVPVLVDDVVDGVADVVDGVDVDVDAGEVDVDEGG